VARLRHPNIVQIHAIGEHQGLPFLSLEYMDGRLAELLAEELDNYARSPRETAAHAYDLLEDWAMQNPLVSYAKLRRAVAAECGMRPLEFERRYPRAQRVYQEGRAFGLQCERQRDAYANRSDLENPQNPA
jgi:hypothetical protein